MSALFPQYGTQLLLPFGPFPPPTRYPPLTKEEKRKRSQREWNAKNYLKRKKKREEKAARAILSQEEPAQVADRSSQGKPQLKMDMSSEISAGMSTEIHPSQQGGIAKVRQKDSSDATKSSTREQRAIVRAFVDEQIVLERQQSPGASSNSNRLLQIYRVHRLDSTLNEGIYVEFIPEDTQFQSFAELRDQLHEEQAGRAGADDPVPDWTACEQYIWQLMNMKLSEEAATVDDEEIEL
jgi:hypothetical protein